MTQRVPPRQDLQCQEAFCILAGQPAKNPGVMLVNVAGGGTWFPRMLEWADLQWRWRNPYTGASRATRVFVLSSWIHPSCSLSSSVGRCGSGKRNRTLQQRLSIADGLRCCPGHVLRFFDKTDLVTQLPDAYNHKPYW